MAQTNLSPDRSDQLKKDKDTLGNILQALMTENPREIVEAALAPFINELTAINLRIEDLRNEDLKYFKSIKAIDELQIDIQEAVNYLSLAAHVFAAGTIENKREFFYPRISASLLSLRSAFAQFQSLQLDTLTPTKPSSQVLEDPEKLSEDKKTLDDILRELIGKNPLQFDESKIEEFITILLKIYERAETFRNKEPKYFISIDGLQANVRTVVDNLAMAADVIGEKNFKEIDEVFLPKITESIPLLRRAYSQFQLQLPEMEDRSQKKEGA